MALIHLTVVTPDGKPYEGEIERVIVRTQHGRRRVHHGAPHRLCHRAGRRRARFTLTDGNVRRAHISGGMLHAASNAVQIIIDSFRWKD